MIRDGANTAHGAEDFSGFAVFGGTARERGINNFVALFRPVDGEIVAPALCFSAVENIGRQLPRAANV